MVEYYEGFLMAVDSLKRTGISLDLYVYDCGKDVSTLKYDSCQERDEKYEYHLRSDASESNKAIVRLRREERHTPGDSFSQKGEEVFNNPAVYQINTPQSYLYSEVYEHFTRQFPMQTLSS